MPWGQLGQIVAAALAILVCVALPIAIFKLFDWLDR